MPELPEVETVANGVNARARGRRIVQVWTSGKPQTFKSPQAEIAAALTGAKIESVRRVGKTIVMTVARNSTNKVGPDKPVEFLIHLGMTGRLLVCTSEMPVAPHTHAVLTLDDGREIRFVDPRTRARQVEIPRRMHNGQHTTHNRLRRARARAADDFAGGFCRALPQPPHADQGCAVEPVTAAWYRQHLCR